MLILQFQDHLVSLSRRTSMQLFFPFFQCEAEGFSSSSFSIAIANVKVVIDEINYES